MKPWYILYRGPLSSCNYACDYCPFAKTKNTRQELLEDERALESFVEWVGAQKREIGILFTPWGEALIHRHYQRAFRRLSTMGHVRRVSAQTNLSCSLEWLDQCDPGTVALWTTFHPTQTDRAGFLRKCRVLDRKGVRYSVGVVGFKEALGRIRALRSELDPDVYLWVNAYKRDPRYYSPEDVEAFESVDPLFRLNTRYHPSRGKSCRAGATSFTVDGAGDVRRCHFIGEVLGNIHQTDFEECLGERACSNERCGCHIGYVHLDDLGLYDVFGEGVLERIPEFPLRCSRAHLDNAGDNFTTGGFS